MPRQGNGADKPHAELRKRVKTARQDKTGARYQDGLRVGAFVCFRRIFMDIVVCDLIDAIVVHDFRCEWNVVQ